MYFVLLVLYFQLFLDQLAGVHNEKTKQKNNKMDPTIMEATLCTPVFF